MKVSIKNVSLSSVGDDYCKSGAKTVPHPEDCQKYLLCDTATETLSKIVTCPDGKLYSTVLKSCQPYYAVTCTVGPSTPPPQALSIVEGKTMLY